MSKSYCFLIGMAVLVLAGCAGPIAQRVATDPRVMIADHQLAQGEYETALHAYQELAASTQFPDYFRLKATDAALRAGQGQIAQKLAHSVNPDELDSVDQDQLLLLKSRLDLSQGKSREAMAKLGAVHLDKLDAQRRAHFHLLRASALNQLGNLLESAHESITASRFQNRPDELLRTHTLTYETLSKLPEGFLATRQPPPPDVLAGWMELVRIVGSGSPARVAQALADWRRRFPNHPADGAFLARLEQNRTAGVEVSPLETTPAVIPPSPTAPLTAAPTAAASFIGVLLPLSGTYSEAATAIKAGLDAAQNADTHPDKLPLRVLDSQSGDIQELYRQLVNEGASAIIGPLTKEQVGALIQSSGLSVPVMALNEVAKLQNEAVYQLSLSPEQEVEQVAASAWFDGQRSALVLAPNSNFGQRIAAHFTTWWKQIGGTVLASQFYPYHSDDYTQPVKTVLASVPPAARGIFVYLVADARDAHLLVPQLQFQTTSALPVYASSQVFSGKSDPASDLDLSGVIFCDVPWLLDRGSVDPLSSDQLAGLIQGTKPDYVKLIAMGIDAYRLLPDLETLKQDNQYRHSGLTGTLALRPGNHFERQMSCAQFQNGHPEIRGTAPIIPVAGVSP
ncbi:MAG: penicillin-binding protein activator [Methylococcaceae bacterium]